MFSQSNEDGRGICDNETIKRNLPKPNIEGGKTGMKKVSMVAIDGRMRMVDNLNG
jgi:hypothetical protein